MRNFGKDLRGLRRYSSTEAAMGTPSKRKGKTRKNKEKGQGTVKIFWLRLRGKLYTRGRMQQLPEKS